MNASSSGHGSLLPAPVCACDQCPTRCPCPCYCCRTRAFDAAMRKALGRWYEPARVAARVVTWVLR